MEDSTTMWRARICFRTSKISSDGGGIRLRLTIRSALEHDRLDGQSKTLVALMNGKPFHAPVANPKKILDVGCGTGAMTYLLARTYPNAQVIGVDFSAVPDGRYTKLNNIEYVQADIMELIKNDGKDPRFQAGSFNYVFSRLLIFGMADWPGYLSGITTLLGPGGFLEVQEPSVTCTKADGTRLAETWWHYRQWKSDAEAIGLDFEAGPRLSAYFERTGVLGEINESVYRFPPVSVPHRPELDGLGDNILPMFTGAMRRMSGPRRSAEEMAKMEDELRSVWAAGFEDGDEYSFYAVVGQKASK